VWQNVGRMLDRSGRYGEHFIREGRYAEDGVFKLAMRFWDSLVENVEALGVDQVLEIGLTTGLIERLGQKYPGYKLYGLDRNERIIRQACESAAAKNVTNIRWIEGDYFDTDRWCKQLDGERPGLIFSLHFHELIAGGEQRFVEALRSLKAALPNWSLLAFEQPRLPHSDRTTIPETLWLYSQSNILIHHLIGNGRILSRDTWMDLGAQAGCGQVSDRPCNYLGYRAFLFQ
jgi:SAM-dependent methyltransferase